MPRKKATEKFEPISEHQHEHEQQQPQEFQNNPEPSSEGNVPQLNVQMGAESTDAMAQMGSPTNQWNPPSETSTPAHGHKQLKGHKKHKSFEEPQPHGYNLRHHHGYDLRTTT